MRKSPWVLVGLLAAEACLFSTSLGKYFCGDSLYFFSHAPQGISQLPVIFTHLDDLSTYRPLTLVIFRFLMLPVAGFTPWPYHLMALGTHLGVTVLVYFLLRRLAGSEAGLFAGIAFFALHSIGFYLSYDATFLPDFSAGLFTAGALLAHAHGRRGWSLALFIAALFCKESAIAIPIGLAVVGWLAAREEPLKTLRPHGIVAVVYLTFQVLLHGGWLYPSTKSAYRFTVERGGLWLKLKYLPWLFNLPADWFRQRWWMIPPIVLMIPLIIWAWQNWRDESAGITAVLCAGWAFAALAPALPVAQVPMKHNLYVPVIALAVAISRNVMRRPAWALLASLFASTAFQIRSDLNTSWVGEGSDITEASLHSVLRAHPVLPNGVSFYILPAKIPGGINWYLDDQELFRRAYNDQSLRVYYADLKRFPPEGFEKLAGVLIFTYDRRQLWDVTAQYKQAVLDPGRRPLLPRFGRATIESEFSWQQAELLEGRAAGVAPSPDGDALVGLPGTRVKIAIDDPLPPDAVLVVGVMPVGKQKEAARGRVLWGGNEITAVFVEEPDIVNAGFLDLSRFAGQTGTLTFENNGGRGADWLAWSRLAITSRHSTYLTDSRDLGKTLGEPLLAQLETASTATTIRWVESEKPNGRVADVKAIERGGQRRTSLVVLPQTTVRISVPAPAPGSMLLVGAGRVGKQRGAAQGRLIWNDIEIARVLIEPRGEAEGWWDDAIDLGRFTGQSGTLVIENTGARDSDWIAWNRLRIVPRSSGAPEVEAGARSLREMSNPLLADFAKTAIATSVAWDPADLAGGRAANLKLLTRSGESHEALLELPSTEVRFPVRIPEHARLHFATTSLGPGEGAIDLDGVRIFHTYLDGIVDSAVWRGHDVDLSAFTGRSGTLAFRNVGDRACASVAWAALHFGAGDPVATRSFSLFDLLSSAVIDFDRTENYPNYDHFDTPGGKPVFTWCGNSARPARLSLVTIAGTRLRYTFASLPERAALMFAMSHGLGVGDGMEGRIYWNGELLYRRYITPAMRDWSDVVILLPRGSSRVGTLSIEVSSGPKHSAIGDWLAWSGLRIGEF